MNPLKTPTSYKQHIEDRFGRKGTPKRDEFDKKMTFSQIPEAQNLARECVRKDYKGC